MNSPRLMGRHTLENGLTLELWDYSRPLTGDRRFVSLEARIIIPLRAETLPPALKAEAGQLAEALGEEIIFSQRQERNFIAASEASALLEDMQDRILALAPGYFGHAEFAARFIRKKNRRPAGTSAGPALKSPGRARLTPPPLLTYEIGSGSAP